MALIQKLTAISNAVRAKTGKTDQLTLNQIATDIKEIVTNGGKISLLIDGSVPKVTENDLQNITEIRGYAFYGCQKLSSVIIPDNISTIGGSAFMNCSELKNVTIIGNSVYTPKSIGASAFRNCSKLKNVTMGSGVKEIKDYAFYSCDGLTDITIPEGVTSIGPYAFHDCSGLTSITIPSSVTSIGNYAFEDCYKLVEVINKSNLNIVAGNTDHGYVAENALIVHTGDTKLVNKNEYVFYPTEETIYFVGYKGTDTALTLPSDYNGQNYEIHDYAFYSCPEIIDIKIPSSVTSIGYGVFIYCPALKSITVDENNTAYKSIDGNLYTKNGTTLIQYAIGKTETDFNIPSGVMSISDCAFYYSKLMNIKMLNSSVKSIGYRAFRNCTNLTSITIPASIEDIGDQAFRGCSALTSITMLATTPPELGENAFQDCSKLGKIIVPKGCVGAYQGVSGWSAYSDRIQEAK